MLKHKRAASPFLKDIFATGRQIGVGRQPPEGKGLVAAEDERTEALTWRPSPGCSARVHHHSDLLLRGSARSFTQGASYR
jgi:hypothetical protein